MKNLPVIVFTFDPHPMEVLGSKPDFRRIFPRESQTQIFKGLGIRGVYYQGFDTEFSRLSAEEFATEKLKKIIHPKVVVVGFNFRFGQNRMGNPEFLRKWGEKNGVIIDIVPPFQIAEQIVSSSSVRQFLSEGAVEQAEALLGFPFFVESPVVHGAQRGRGVGFPTANQHWKHTLVPQFGVYATRSHFKGQMFPSVSHLGPVPTFDEAQPRLETHILDQNLSLYGETLKVEFLKRLRGPEKFAGIEELKTQIQKDIQHAREVHIERASV